jgi:hypothetical protein
VVTPNQLIFLNFQRHTYIHLDRDVVTHRVTPKNAKKSCSATADMVRGIQLTAPKAGVIMEKWLPEGCNVVIAVFGDGYRV